MKTEKLKSITSYWYVWLFPLFALMICGWLIYKYLGDRGPTIRISFEDASSIQADKTYVRYRGVNIGKVKKIAISDDNKEVVASVELQRESGNFAVVGTKFWVVSPKVNFKEVSGLETLFAGTYIAAQPGNPDGEANEDFKGLLSNDSENNDNTVPYFLETPNAESVSPGNQVTFRGLEIGTVKKVSLVKGSQLVQVQIQIHHKFMKLIRTNTAFWRKNAVQAKLGLFGSELKVNSLDTILHGGIEVFTPDGPGAVAKPLSRFFLNETAPKNSEKWNPVLE